jgi:hypothetical protein
MTGRCVDRTVQFYWQFVQLSDPSCTTTVRLDGRPRQRAEVLVNTNGGNHVRGGQGIEQGFASDLCGCLGRGGASRHCLARLVSEKSARGVVGSKPEASEKGACAQAKAREALGPAATTDRYRRSSASSSSAIRRSAFLSRASNSSFSSWTRATSLSRPSTLSESRSTLRSIAKLPCWLDSASSARGRLACAWATTAIATTARATSQGLMPPMIIPAAFHVELKALSVAVPHVP